MKKIAFFDLNIIGIGRYPLKIAKEIEKENDNVEFYFLYEEDPDNKIDEIKEVLPIKSQLIRIKKPNYRYLKNLMQEINPDSFLVMAQRIPDSALVSVANDLGIKTFKFQHGLYIPFMKRNISMLVSKITKTVRYLRYSLVIAEAIKENKIRILKEYINIFLRGKKITHTNLPLNKINVNTVFVYGEYWKQYHNEEFGYSYEQQIIVGYPDLMQLEEIKQRKKEDAICYICQTLVEDGRLKREQMEEFINVISENIGDKKLYIKLHPRSDMTLYKLLQHRKNIIFVKTDFPHCSKYIGHYSSMLAIAMYLTDDIFLWKFENHNEYPFYLVQNSKYLSNNLNDFLQFMNINKKTVINQNDIEKYFMYSNNPSNVISKYMMRNI